MKIFVKLICQGKIIVDEFFEKIFFLFSHKFWGKTIFLLAVGAVLMGITEYGIL